MSWTFWIDRGGTFTDCIGLQTSSGTLRVTKVLSSDDAPLIGIRELLGLHADDPLPPCELRLGTTLATNALLERRGEPCALVITRGFADLPIIGDQSRRDIFSLEIDRPPPLFDRVIEVDARLAADGTVLAEPDDDALRAELTAVHEQGIRSVAIVVMHAYERAELEQRMAAIAREVGLLHITCGHEVSAELGLLARTDTAVVDAYLTPLLTRYVAHLHEQLTPPSTLRLMQSSGGLTDGQRFRGRDAVLSGPAGGVVALAELAQRKGLPAVIGFDMGGTSTDVCRYAGAFERVFETTVAGVRIRTPMMSLHTVAAGGGSLCRFDGHRLLVGPHSAGASPGPLCYGHPDATELALTDINLALGRLLPDRFPFALHPERVSEALGRLASTLGRSSLELAQGFFDIAVDNMAQAIRQITIARGHDVREHALVVFGGAGGQHACAVASVLGIRKLVFDPLAGVLSARGIGVAALTWHGEHDAGRVPLDADDLEARLSPHVAKLEAAGEQALRDDGAKGELVYTRTLDLRYAGTQTNITVELGDPTTMRDAFEAEHARTFGYARAGHPIELVTVRVEVATPPGAAQPARTPPQASKPTGPASVRMMLAGESTEVPTVIRESLAAGQRIDGPALILEATGTIVLEPHWTASVDDDGVLIAIDTRPDARRSRGTPERDPVRLEIMGNRFMSIAEQMGVVLRRTSLSTNIRERLDFSCAVFDADAGLVANAPHMPVHLGAMGESVAAIARQHPHPKPGDVFATNDPAAGGSHLPDITVVTPVFIGGPEAPQVAFYTASRGHHADVGGITPGSMPPDAIALAQEGVVFRGQTIVSRGTLAEASIRETLASTEYPARRPDENLADLQAQIAANQTGARLLEALCAEQGLPVVTAYMKHVQDHGAEAVQRLLGKLPAGTRSFTDHNDDGTPIAVTVEVEHGEAASRLRIDFTGTGPAGEHNLNAPRAVTVAAVLYVLRAMVGEPIPLNRGCMRAVELHVPPGCLLDPPPGCAVAGGNVETAQRVVDVLLAAFDRKAACQGTMNNLTFGDGSFGYYETIGGGEGATATHDGQSGVHTHMTNTRITDPEILETRFPVRLHRFALRRGSGGAGRHRGGDGLVREIEFLAPLEVSILSDRRVRAPFGLHGGLAGAPGTHRIGERALPGRANAHVQPGERLIVETPGGGGFDKTAS